MVEVAFIIAGGTLEYTFVYPRGSSSTDRSLSDCSGTYLGSCGTVLCPGALLPINVTAAFYSTSFHRQQFKTLQSKQETRSTTSFIEARA